MGRFLDRVLALTPQTPEASTVPAPIGKYGLWRHKGWQLPPYIQHVRNALMREGHSETQATHMAVGIVKNWAAGHDGHGHRTHPDVRAAAAGNVARWEELKGKAHAVTAAKHATEHRRRSEHDLAACWEQIGAGLVAFTAPEVMLGLPAGAVTAPGARPLAGRLVHVPSQTVQAGPPLPPGVELPSPAELDALGTAISRAGDSDLLRGAAQHARTAAMKMRAGQAADALALLRSAQAGIISAHREFNASQIPVANVWSASLAPAEQASARAQMLEGLGTREKFRGLASQCAQLIDRIRRHIFHGMYGGMAEARF